nr:cation:proton antiporter [bacterium]
MPIFIELSLIIVLATVISLIMKLLRQPLIVGYIATGIIAGPYVLNLLHSQHELELFSKIGISILLFIVGLTLNPEIVREVGKSSFIVGLLQVILTAGIGFAIALAFGLNIVPSIYVALALTFSSTIIVLKLLADRGDSSKLYGKVAVGLLLVQDVIATLVLLAITVIGNAASTGGTSFEAVGIELVRLFLLGGLVTTLIYLVSKYFLPKFSWVLGSNQEILFVFSIAWGLGLAALFQVIGFSIEIGALIAGMMLAVSPFAYEIGARMKPLRDFFILIFFILLGSQLVFSSFTMIIIPALLLSVFVLLGKPLIVLVLMNLNKYRTKTAFMTGLTVAQISEFSLILCALGFSLGHITKEVVSLITFVGIITIAGSTYLILYSDQLYTNGKNFFDLFTFRKKHIREHSSVSENPETIIFGYDRVGHDFVSAVQDISQNYIVVDYNPKSIHVLREKNIPHRYGDAEDVEFLQEIGFSGAQLVISSIPDHMANLLLVRYYRKTNHTGVIITLAHHIQDAKELYAAGASYVVMPHYLGAHHAALLIGRHGLDASGFEVERNIHLAKLDRHG